MQRGGDQPPGYSAPPFFEPEPEPELEPELRQRQPLSAGGEDTLLAHGQLVAQAVACVRGRAAIPLDVFDGIVRGGGVGAGGGLIRCGRELPAALAAYGVLRREDAGGERHRVALEQLELLIHALAGLAGHSADGRPPALLPAYDLEERRGGLQGRGLLGRSGDTRRFIFHVVSPFVAPLPPGVELGIVGSLPELGEGRRFSPQASSHLPSWHRFCTTAVPLETAYLRPSASPTSRSRVLEADVALSQHLLDGDVDWKAIRDNEAMGELGDENRKDTLSQMRLALRVAGKYSERGDDANALACCAQGLKLRNKAFSKTQDKTGFLGLIGSSEAKYTPEEVQRVVRGLEELQEFCGQTWFRFTVAIQRQGKFILHKSERKDWYRVTKGDRSFKFLDCAADPFPLSQLRQPSIFELSHCVDEGLMEEPQLRMLGHAFWWLVEAQSGDRSLTGAFRSIQRGARYQTDISGQTQGMDTSLMRLSLLQTVHQSQQRAEDPTSPALPQLQKGVMLMWLVAGLVVDSRQPRDLSGDEMHLLCECLAPGELQWVQSFATGEREFCARLHGWILKVATYMAQRGVIGFLRVVPLLNALDPKAEVRSELTVHDPALSSHMSKYTSNPPLLATYRDFF